jgi:hypothetical protein
MNYRVELYDESGMQWCYYNANGDRRLAEHWANMMVKVSGSQSYKLSFKENNVCIYKVYSKHFKEKE